MALPSLGVEFGLSIDQGPWVVQGFLVSATVLLLPAGRAADLFSHRSVYLAGFGVLGATALVCGLAPSFVVLVLARVLQGVSGALIMASGPALLTTSVPASQRGRALGVAATATYAGLTGGPPLAGLLLGVLDWRWIFLLNVPVAAVILGLGGWLLPKAPRRAEARPGRAGALALVDVRRLRSRGLTAAALAALCNYVALFVAVILLPFYLIEGRGLAPQEAGLILSSQPLLMALCAWPSGWLSDRIGTRALATLGMAALALGMMGLSTLDARTPLVALVAWLSLVGLGTGVFISPNSSALMGAAPQSVQGLVGSVLALARNLGMFLGVALAMTVFEAAGGRTGQAWGLAEYEAIGPAFWVAAGVAFLGAGAAFGCRKEAPS
jgi:MFS family permease